MGPVKILGIILYCILFIASSSFGQGNWSLKECIEYAHQNNLQIKQQQLTVEEAQNNILQAKLNFIPSFNASLNHNMNWGKSVNINDLQITNTLSQSSSASISASVPLLQGLSKTNTLKSNKVELLISQCNTEKLKNDITVSITQAFLQILLSEEIYKCARQSLNSMEEQVSRTKRLVEAGNQAYSTLLDMEAQLSNERMQLVAARNNVKVNYLALMQLLDLPQGGDFSVKAPETDKMILDFIDEDPDSIYNRALSLPQVRSAELSLEKSKYDYKIQKGNLYPTISFSAGYGTYYSDSQQRAFFDQFNDNRNPSVGFSMSIPIFNGWRTANAVRNAHLNVERSRLELQQTHQQLYKDITQAHTDASNAYEKYIASQQSLKSGRESFNHVEQKFNAGMLNSTDYIVAKNNLFKSESECCQAMFQYIFQLKILDFYKGIPINL